MDSEPFLVSTLLNGNCYAKTLIDTGCLSYGLIDSRFAIKNGLQRIPITPRGLSGFDAPSTDQVTEVAVVSMDIDGHVEAQAFFYVVPRLASYNMILGLPWLKKQSVQINTEYSECLIESSMTIVRNRAIKADLEIDCIAISAVAFKSQARKKHMEVFSVSIADINKALKVKARTDPRTKLPKQYYEFLKVFSKEEADKLSPLRGEGIDHAIELESSNGKEAKVPWGPLYNMSRDELLALRKTLTEYLDKGFIRVSNSPAAAPVLFVRKPGGGLRFCVDYRGLNKITRKDRYPLPLIYETLRNIEKAKWFTKLDVIAAFHKIRIAKGDEWKTAFRTRYGLYEWLVTPFGLANAPSTFQRFINWALRDYIDDFCSAYIDDILIYTDGTIDEHREHVRKVLRRIQEAGLQLDIDKCEFEVKRTKYLGFIIVAGEGIQMDPEKVKAIQEWEAPKTATAVRSFLGFANFYRTFIKNYSDLTLTLTHLTHKETPFIWDDDCQRAFDTLKKMFTSAPLLVRFDYDRETVIETDSSGWCIGGTLMQLNDDGVFQPCAFFSKKNSPAECNYEIYDKEMLAIVRSLEVWDAELRSVQHFEIRTDHKNLEYFMTVRKLTERQMRWSLILSRYNFTIAYIPGKTNERADALSRREQDMPKGVDSRTDYRTTQLLKPYTLRSLPQDTIQASPVNLRPRSKETQAELTGVNLEHPLKKLWEDSITQDKTYQDAIEAVRQGSRVFPPDLKLKVSIGECSLSAEGLLMFRGRLWVPEKEELRTKMTQEIHDSKACGHPGRDNTAQILGRQYFWPRMSEDVRRFVRNCDVCGRTRSWRDKRQGFLKPLPIPSQIWKEISIDFIVDLPESNGCTNLLVITDRLSKGILCDGLPDISAETLAKWFVRAYYRHHYLPSAIVSDRGTSFIGKLWSRICQLLGIVRRLSTAYHPETDGATERMNQTLETYLRMFVDFAQDDWYDALPGAEIAINNRNAASTGVSPFFLQHGYHIDPLNLHAELTEEDVRRSPVQKADMIIRKLKDAREWAQSAMASAQQVMEEVTNRRRSQAPSFNPGDKVWLDLKNIRTNRPTKKLDAKYAKYTVLEAVGSHSFRLDTPPGIHNVFHSKLLRLASYDPLPSQIQDDSQPQPQLIAEDLEYEVEGIQKEKVVRGKKKYLVKWTGYAQPTWEPEDALKDSAALEKWTQRT
jgi:transposase InsO family protein/predicted aspartyl protease